jgi:hypothetical protein
MLYELVLDHDSPCVLLEINAPEEDVRTECDLYRASDPFGYYVGGFITWLKVRGYEAKRLEPVEIEF